VRCGKVPIPKTRTFTGDYMSKNGKGARGHKEARKPKASPGNKSHRLSQKHKRRNADRRSNGSIAYAEGDPRHP